MDCVIMKRLSNFFGYLAIFLFILSFAIAFTINFTPLYSFDIGYLNIEELTGFSKEVIMENYRILLKYLNYPWITELNMPDFPSSESGLFHFYEVKRLFMLDYAILFLSGIYSFFFIRKKVKEGDKWEMIQPTRIMMAIPIVVLIFIFLNFNSLFITFHELFFNNDAWLFDWRTDPIILALPQSFFMHCFISVFLILESGIAGLYFWSKQK
ncbi:MAG TPA: TIGR01906 family membrane protein [Candidatus Jeotgalibaca pullicola]|nr:TIGR01906 family membrane protein [Candidatus Jeotgalibaca pullicola]